MATRSQCQASNEAQSNSGPKESQGQCLTKREEGINRPLSQSFLGTPIKTPPTTPTKEKEPFLISLVVSLGFILGFYIFLLIGYHFLLAWIVISRFMGN